MEPTLAVMERAGTALGLPEARRSPVARIGGVDFARIRESRNPHLTVFLACEHWTLPDN